jgi:hypothetical protein
VVEGEGRAEARGVSESMRPNPREVDIAVEDFRGGVFGFEMNSSGSHPDQVAGLPPVDSPFQFLVGDK